MWLSLVIIKVDNGGGWFSHNVIWCCLMLEASWVPLGVPFSPTPEKLLYNGIRVARVLKVIPSASDPYLTGSDLTQQDWVLRVPWQRAIGLHSGAVTGKLNENPSLKEKSQPCVNFLTQRCISQMSHYFNPAHSIEAITWVGILISAPTKIYEVSSILRTSSEGHLREGPWGLLVGDGRSSVRRIPFHLIHPFSLFEFLNKLPILE